MTAHLQGETEAEVGKTSIKVIEQASLGQVQGRAPHMHVFQNLPQLRRKKLHSPFPCASQPSRSSRDKADPLPWAGMLRPTAWTVGAHGPCISSRRGAGPAAPLQAVVEWVPRSQLPAPLWTRSPHNCICNSVERLASCQVSCHLRFQLKKKKNEINWRGTPPPLRCQEHAELAGGRGTELAHC